MTNPTRRSALSRHREPHPAATAAAAAATPEVTAPPPARPTRSSTADEGRTQLNVRVRVSLKSRAEQASYALGIRERRRVTLNELVEQALIEYLDTHEL